MEHEKRSMKCKVINAYINKLEEAINEFLNFHGDTIEIYDILYQRDSRSAVLSVLIFYKRINT